MSLYAYTSATGSRKVVDSTNLSFTGLWNGSTAYDPRDVADDGFSHHWIALVANTNVPLPAVFDTTTYATWSHLVNLEVPVTPSSSALPGDWLPDVWSGTNYAGTLFGEALALAQAGTNGANQAYSLALQALNTAWAGTNQPAIDGVYSIAVTALNTAWTGTDAANAANQLAGEAYTLAAAGTAAAAGKVSKSGDTMTGNLVVPNIQVSVGTLPTSVLSNGTMYYDFAGPAYQKTTVDQDIFVSGTNMSTGAGIAVLLLTDGSGTNYALNFSPSITFYGDPPPVDTSLGNVLVAMTSLGNTLDDVIAAAATPA